MDWSSTLARARRGLREDGRLHLVAASSLTVAFLCLAAALLVVTNLSELSDRWTRSGRMTVYVRDDARRADVEQLRAALEKIEGVTAATLVSAARARQRFLRQAGTSGGLVGLPAEAFPTSIEVMLRAGTSAPRGDRLAARLRRLEAVEDVETYRGWLDRLGSLLAAVTAGVLGLGLLVVVCVLAVVGNTIRLAVAGRRAEIEVMKLCGATDSFVRAPFVVEGAVQGLVASLLALLLLLGGFAVLRSHLDSTVAVLTGVHAVFLKPQLVAAMMFGGAVAGAAGSALSLRRYLSV